MLSDLKQYLRPRAVPDFLIIGGQKCGTSFLYQALASHPSFQPAVKKEVHFFDRSDHYEKGWFWYKRHFPQRGKGLRFEASPRYLVHPEAPGRIRKWLGRLPLIAVLRDPVERALSAWVMYHHRFKDRPELQHRYEPRSFEEVIREELKAGPEKVDDPRAYIARGYYSVQIGRYLEHFPKEALLLLDLATLKEDPRRCFERIFRHLGLSEDAERLPNTALVADKNEREFDPEVDEELLDRLREHFVPYDKELEALWGERFSWFIH